MPGVQDVEHVKLRVPDLDEAAKFQTDVVGLTELERTDESVYFGCRRDGNYDLALTEGEHDLDHIAVTVDDTSALDQYESRLQDRGIGVKRVDGEEPGQEYGIRFTLPGGATMELVRPEDKRYANKTSSSNADRSAITPLDLDHLALQTNDVKTDAELLRDALDFKISDVIGAEEGPWGAAWTRYGRQHHGVFFSDNEGSGANFHHLAWAMTDLSHLKQFTDHLVQSGGELEMGVGRHNVGDNLFAYFKTPSGIRMEITTELEVLDPGASPDFYDTIEETVFAWGGTVVPEGFMAGYDAK